MKKKKIYIWITESLCCTAEINTTLLINCISINFLKKEVGEGLGTANMDFLLFLLFALKFIYVFMTEQVFIAAWGLSPVAAIRAPLVSVHGLLALVASLAAERGSRAQRLSSCSAWAQLLRSMWDLPGSRIKPVSPALAGKFASEPPGKSLEKAVFIVSYSHHWRGRDFLP